ncbi:MAG TPA: T9SS type A sorting domain-containing protein [Bacteroidia bacterium]|nr:T9SS type A sorting domain-containing protein [Bacteroidia bacterium]
MKKYILRSAAIFLFLFNIQVNAQSNLQITFYAASSALAGVDTVFMYSGVAVDFPGNFNQFMTGELAQPGSGLGRMTEIAPDQWSICLEPFAYFSQGLSGAIPAGKTMYGIGDILFHNPSSTIIVQLNNNSANFQITLQATSTNIITQPSTNSSGQLDAGYIPCSLGINDIQIPNGLITNYPNPLVDKTEFLYSLKSAGKVSLKIYNTIGQIVKTIVNNEFQSPNKHTYKWAGDNDSGRKLFNGVYYYTLSVNSKVVQTNKLIISR